MDGYIGIIVYLILGFIGGALYTRFMRRVSGADLISVCTSAATSARIRIENEKQKVAQLQAENDELRAALLLSVEDRCAKYHIQDCYNCLRADCSDNINPLYKNEK